MSKIDEFAKANGITMRAEFVPWSRSRHFKPGAKTTEKQLNWRVTILKGGHEVLTTDYSAGIAHCPSYKLPGIWSIPKTAAVEFEVEHGRACGYIHAAFPRRGDPLLPRLDDVLASLAMDASAIDHPTFESWAREYGYDTDSRKAEAAYRACLEIALKMRAGLGEQLLAELRQIEH